MSDLQIFKNSEFGEVRTVVINNEPHFVGKDVAEILGYDSPSAAVSKKVDKEDRGLSKMETPSGVQEMTIINESGLFSLVLSSKLPTAKRFKHWVTSEVLPALRKTGSYTIPQVTPNPKYRTRMISTAVRDVEKTKEAIMKMFKVKDGIAYTKAMALIEPAYGIDLAPIKTLVPAATHETGYINPTEIGKRLGGIKPQEVNIMLENMHFQHKEGKDWRLDKAGQDYGEEIPYTRNGHSGYQIRWNANVISALQIGT